MLSALATSSATSSTPSKTRHVLVKDLAASSPMPLPVASAVRSHISCTDAINGSVTSADHSRPNPNLAPAWT